MTKVRDDRLALRARPLERPTLRSEAQRPSTERAAPDVLELDSALKAGPSLSPPEATTLPLPRAPLYEQTALSRAISTAYGSVGTVVHSAARVLASELRATGTTFRAVGAGLPQPLAVEADAVGSSFERFTDELDAHLALEVFDAEAVRGRAQRLADDGTGFSTRLSHAVRESGHALADLATTAASAAQRAVRAVSAFTGEVLKATDYRDHVAKLGPSDSYTLGLDGYLDAVLARVKGRSSVKVSRDDTGYTVAVDGALGGGLVMSWGAAVGLAGLSMQNALVGEAGGAIELRFETAEQATQAVEVLLRAPQRTVPVTDETPLASWDDLWSRLSACEVAGTAGVDLNGTLGVVLFGGNATSGVRTTKSMRLETSERGPQLVVRSVVASSSVGDTGSSMGDLAAAPVFTGNQQLELGFVHRYDFPEGVGFDDVTRAPLKHANGLRQHGPVEVELTFELDSGVLGQMSGRGGKVSLVCESSDAIPFEVIRHLGQGDLVGAVRALPGGELTGDVRPHKKFGVRLTPNLSVMGVSAGVDFVAQRLDARPEERSEVKGTGDDVAKLIARSYVRESGNPLDLFRTAASALLQKR